jgi:membrane-associated phospholipid phosphatase
MRIAAQILSYVVHPVLLGTVATFYLLYLPSTYIYYTIPAEVKRFVLLLTIFSTVIIPVLFTWYLFQTRKISSLQMANRAERIIPLVMGTSSYFVLYWLLYRIGTPALMNTVVLVATILVASALIITQFVKISIHVMGAAGLVGILYGLQIMHVADDLYLLATLIGVTGIVGTTRIYLGAHSIVQVALGALVGFLVPMIAMIFGLS